MMKLKCIAIGLTIFIHACTSPPQMEATTVVTEQPFKNTPAEISATETIGDPNYFRDDFDAALAPDWQWLREDPNNWSLTAIPGVLQINVDGGEVSDETIRNLLLRTAPAGNFQIETKVTFSPVANYQIAGLIIYESPQNIVQAGRAFCDLPDTCVGDGLYVDYYQDGNFVTPNYAAPYPESQVYLRLMRQSDTYTFQSSSNGSQWILRGGTVSTMNPLQVGLVAGQNTSSVIPAQFDYFEIRSLP
jgi:beta-xylosidase